MPLHEMHVRIKPTDDIFPSFLSTKLNNKYCFLSRVSKGTLMGKKHQDNNLIHNDTMLHTLICKDTIK